MNRLSPVIDRSRAEELAERFDDHRFVLAVDRSVDRLAVGALLALLGLVEGPVPENAEAPELLPLDPDEPLRVLPAAPALLERWEPRPGVAQIEIDAVLDRQTVAVPSRHVGNVESHHHAGLHDEVLQDLVERLAEMDVVVGVGRPVVQDEDRPAAPRLPDRRIDLPRGPPREALGLVLRKVRLHREARPWKIDGRLHVRLLAHVDRSKFKKSNTLAIASFRVKEPRGAMKYHSTPNENLSRSQRNVPAPAGGPRSDAPVSHGGRRQSLEHSR